MLDHPCQVEAEARSLDPPGHARPVIMATLRARAGDGASPPVSAGAVEDAVELAAEKVVTIPAALNHDTLVETSPHAKLFAAMPGYTFPAMTCHTLRDAVLMKHGAVVVNGHEVLGESLEGDFASNGFIEDGQGGFVIDAAKRGERVTRPVIVIHKWGVFNYALWLSEMLTRVHLLSQLPHLDDVPIVIHFLHYMTPRTIETRFRTLGYLGVPRSRVIVSAADHLPCDRLYFPCVNSRYRNHRIGQNLDEMTNMLRERIVGPAGTKPTDLLYVARSDAGERRIVNEAELIKALEKFGFRAVLGSTMEFEEQVRAYARARLVFGTHGAGLANIAFAPRGTPVIEVFPDGYVGRWMYRMMAYAKGHPYFADKVDLGLCNKTERRDFLVDVEKCVRLVERAMKHAQL